MRWPDGLDIATALALGMALAKFSDGVVKICHCAAKNTRVNVTRFFNCYRFYSLIYSTISIHMSQEYTHETGVTFQSCDSRSFGCVNTK